MPLQKDAVLTALTGRFADFYQQFTLLKPLSGELRGSCPIHKGDGPNFAVNADTGLWHCFSDCQDGGDVFRFIELLESVSFPDALARVASFAGLSDGFPVRTERRMPAAPKADPILYLDNAIAEQLHQNLMNSDKVRRWLSDHRGLTTETLTHFHIGLQLAAAKGEEWRVCFPVYDRQGRLTNIRRHLFAYKQDLTDERRRELGKTKPWQPGLRADLYPLRVLDGAAEALLVEGEADCILANQMGITAVTGTGGAGTWHDRWSDDLRGLSRVTILYDSDQAGQDGAQKAAASISRVVADVRIARYGAWLGKDKTE